jgi:hypothetical protein
MDQEHNFNGNSFAVAHVSVKVAQILVSSRNADFNMVMNKLSKVAQSYRE